MNYRRRRPHLAKRRKGNRKKFRIKPFHYTLGVIGLLHVVALVWYFSGNNDEPGGSGDVLVANDQNDQAEVTWTDVDSMVPPAEVEPTEPEAPKPPEPEPVGEVIPAVARAVPAEPEAPVDPENLVPTMKATLAEEPATASPPNLGAPTTGTGDGFGAGANDGFDFTAYDHIISTEFYRAWEQPRGVSIPEGHNIARLYVTIGRDGKVEQFSLAQLTGIPELDSSVLAAARKVRRLVPIPDDYGGDNYKIAINFELD